jgi:hypothetical protein
MDRKLNDRWFKEDRKAYSGVELSKQKSETEKALRNSTVLLRRLKEMLEEDIEKTYLTEEEYDTVGWERKVLACAVERKTLRKILDLLP